MKGTGKSSSYRLRFGTKGWGHVMGVEVGGLDAKKEELVFINGRGTVINHGCN